MCNAKKPAFEPCRFGHPGMCRNSLLNICLCQNNSLRGGMVQNTVTSTGSVAAEWQSNLCRFLCKSPLGSLRCIAHIHTRCATQKSLLLNHACAANNSGCFFGVARCPVPPLSEAFRRGIDPVHLRHDQPNILIFCPPRPSVPICKVTAWNPNVSQTSPGSEVSKQN